jgi:NAD(P)-dependent dehydrogenase (short-subunit alcohol dehydrogenase family)
MHRLTDRVFLVTGGGSGIGEACARRYAAEGARVAIADIDETAAREAAARIGGRAAFIRADHTVRSDNEAAVAFTVATFGALDVLHNNAGVPHRGAIQDCDEASLRRVVEVNLIGPFLMTQAALPALRRAARARGGAAILFTASIQSIMVRPGFTVYGASKHGLAGLIASLALELAPEGIRVNGLCPGPVDTPLFRRIVAAAGDLESGIAAFRDSIPMRRLVKMDDVAAAAAFLASDEASMITGALLPVDGGITAR